MNRQQGFTLVELVIVIVILGILAATAVPRFVDLSEDAAQAAVNGVAAGVMSAATINYAAKSAGKNVTPTTLAGTNTAVCTKTNLDSLLVNNMPASYTVAAATGAPGNCSAGEPMSCTITGEKTKVATAHLVCY